MSIADPLPKYICPRCVKRIKDNENAVAELAAFKRSARSAMEHGRKRTKETTSEVGVSPDTFRERPRAKVARKKLHFTSK